ncbi:MAG: hypothetical protein QG670_2153 [Thermoproteota archaeon]|nr:hypothetical protein [Thermoproteota archaeon]
MNINVARKLLTSTVSDPYGRRLGKIVGFTVDSKNDVANLAIELANGDLSCYPCTQTVYENDTIIIDYPWKVEATKLSNEYALILRKNFALDKLRNDGEIIQEVYDEMQKQNDMDVKKITERFQILLNDVKCRIESLNKQIKQIKTFIANMKIEHIIGNISDEDYRVSAYNLQTMMDQASLEKNDVEIINNKLTKKQEIPETVVSELSKITNQPQPIVLRIQETVT